MPEPTPFIRDHGVLHAVSSGHRTSVEYSNLRSWKCDRQIRQGIERGLSALSEMLENPAESSRIQACRDTKLQSHNLILSDRHQ